MFDPNNENALHAYFSGLALQALIAATNGDTGGEGVRAAICADALAIGWEMTKQFQSSM